jgi:hypothetical protein
MTLVTFTPAIRTAIPLLLGVAGGTGSGKTMSALLLARGIAEGQPFAFIDTENGRGLHYADAFPEMQHGRLDAPFLPDRYTQAIADGSRFLTDVPREKRVVVVDSFSHEWAGDGGCLDWKDEITGGDNKRSPVAWATVKPAHKKMMTRLLQLDAHVILCFRAEEKMDIVREGGEIKFVPKTTLPGGSLDGWVPVTEKNVPYEMTASFLLMADAPGTPKPIKLEAQHKPMVPLDQPLTEETGRLLAAWAAGGATAPAVSALSDAEVAEIVELASKLMAYAEDHGTDEAMRARIDADAEAKEPKAHLAWLRRQAKNLDEKIASAA